MSVNRNILVLLSGSVVGAVLIWEVGWFCYDLFNLWPEFDVLTFRIVLLVAMGVTVGLGLMGARRSATSHKRIFTGLIVAFLIIVGSWQVWLFALVEAEYYHVDIWGYLQLNMNPATLRLTVFILSVATTMLALLSASAFIIANKARKQLRATAPACATIHPATPTDTPLEARPVGRRRKCQLAEDGAIICPIYPDSYKLPLQIQKVLEEKIHEILEEVKEEMIKTKEKEKLEKEKPEKKLDETAPEVKPPSKTALHIAEIIAKKKVEAKKMEEKKVEEKKEVQEVEA